MKPDLEELIIRIDERQQSMEARQIVVQNAVNTNNTRFLELIEAHQKKDEAEMQGVRAELTQLNTFKTETTTKTRLALVGLTLAATLGWDAIKTAFKSLFS